MKVVILAGGKGTRLGLTDRPKPMAEIAGTSLLERQVALACRSGFTDFVFLTGHLGEVIEAYFGDGARFGARIEHVREQCARGTAGAVRDARQQLSEPFLLLYGDTLVDVDLAHFADAHRTSGAVATLFVHPNDHPQDSDLVLLDDAGRVDAFLSKPHAPGALLPNLVNAALYALDPRAIDYISDIGTPDWGRDVFPAMLAAGEKLQGYRSLEYIKDMGTPERLAQGGMDLASGRVERLSRRHAKPAIFLDRDGVLNVERGGVHHAEDLVLEADAGPAVRRINRAGIPAICVTNQPDLAKGLVDSASMRAIFAALDSRLADAGAYLDDVYFCPHHPETGWPGEVAALKIACNCRKPAPGMLLRAAEAHHLDLARSWMIGDRYADIAAAKAVGASAVLVQTGHNGNDSSQFACTPDHVSERLSDAVDHVLEAMR